MTRSYHLAFFITGGFFACAACLGALVELLASRNTNMSNYNGELTKSIVDDTTVNLDF